MIRFENGSVILSSRVSQSIFSILGVVNVPDGIRLPLNEHQIVAPSMPWVFLIDQRYRQLRNR